METIKQTENITKLTNETQSQLIRAFARLPTEERPVVMKLQKSLFHALRQKYNEVSLELLSYTSLILAIKEQQDGLHEVDKKSFVIKRHTRRKSRAKEKLLGYWALIKTLKLEKQMSFRDIASYLQKYHKFEVTHSTVYELWREFEVNNKNNGESKC